MLQAHQRKQPLTLITLWAKPLAQETEKISRLIGSSPLFEGLNRQRLQNALSIGPARFIMEWLNTDPRAEEQAMISATPELWTACGYRAVPEGLAFEACAGRETRSGPGRPHCAEQTFCGAVCGASCGTKS